MCQLQHEANASHFQNLVVLLGVRSDKEYMRSKAIMPKRYAVD